MSDNIIRTDINRASKNYTRYENFLRVLWGGIRLFFRYSPRIFFAWRVFLLRIFGAKIGRNVHIYNTAVIYMPWNLEIGDWSAIGENALIYNLGWIQIGKNTTISQRVHLCGGTHDYTQSSLPLIKKPIHICDNAWVCADAFIGPDVTVGEGAIVGARAVVTKEVRPWTIVAGNPAKFIKERVLRA